MVHLPGAYLRRRGRVYAAAFRARRDESCCETVIQPGRSVYRTGPKGKCPHALNEAALHRMHHCFQSVVRPELFVDGVQVIP
jgi:hypothetical protein